MSETHRTIRIAISGGGLAGASLLYALLQHPHIDGHIFESSAAFKEAGMAIGVARNALTALDLMGSSQCLERAGAVAMRGVRFLLAEGDKPGCVVDEVDYTTSGNKRLVSIVHRADFLRELLADVPPERMHASKKLDRVEKAEDESLTLHFVDGTTYECDILIGADGIHSFVRKLVLGADDPAASPRNTGWWTAMTLQPYAAAQASLGKDAVNFEDPYEHSWIGRGCFLMHNLLGNGQLVQLVVAAKEKEAEGSDRWVRTVSIDELRRLYQNWPPHLSKAVDTLLSQQPSQPAMYLWEHHLPARTYVSGATCIIGDAAHATTPWQGSGGGMSLEDSLVLSTLLGHATNPSEARLALQAYDHVRRPRTQRIVESSRGTGAILSGEGDDPCLKEPGSLLRRWDFILDLNVEEHTKEAVELMDRLKREGEAQVR
ncbi:Salicylate hydroxylase [Madurella mycetomatis]|uniref:Salicylate hydroxylase n=1 Tax=Madurella mycetomatis TaxID=100816 RepID=A0A175W6U5_9PEZI|nr:Salicylate hydroxylase [Madurella mycetomatis]